MWRDCPPRLEAHSPFRTSSHTRYFSQMIPTLSFFPQVGIGCSSSASSPQFLLRILPPPCQRQSSCGLYKQPPGELIKRLGALSLPEFLLCAIYLVLLKCTFSALLKNDINFIYWVCLCRGVAQWACGNQVTTLWSPPLLPCTSRGSTVVTGPAGPIKCPLKKPWAVFSTADLMILGSLKMSCLILYTKREWMNT